MKRKLKFGLGPVPAIPNYFKDMNKYCAARAKFYASRDWQQMRRSVINRDGAVCAYCGATDVTLHVDHAIPLIKAWNWRLHPKNLQVLCERCNMEKGGMTPGEYAIYKGRMIQ